MVQHPTARVFSSDANPGHALSMATHRLLCKVHGSVSLVVVLTRPTPANMLHPPNAPIALQSYSRDAPFPVSGRSERETEEVLSDARTELGQTRRLGAARVGRVRKRFFQCSANEKGRRPTGSRPFSPEHEAESCKSFAR